MADWQDSLDALEARRAAARAMGGDERLAKRRAQGRLNARERVDELCDDGSFRELGTLVGGLERGGRPAAPADALVAGTGLLDGRPVAVFAEDFTVQGGSIGHGNAAKRLRVAHLALQERMPLIMLLEGAGERATNALEPGRRTPNDLQALAELSGQVPIVAAVMGASAGHGALCAMLADFIVMVEGSAIFSAGPPLVQAALGEVVTKDELGGAEMHTSISGVAHNLAASDTAALALVRDYLGHLPSSAWHAAPASGATADVGPRVLDEILDIVPAAHSRPYDMTQVIELLADDARVLEVQPTFGSSMITAFARLGGRSIAVVANQPSLQAGSITHDAADKAARFLDIANSFGLPVVFLADNPGIMSGSAAERAGTLRAAARMYAAQARLRVPKLHVTLRKAFGFGSSIMAMNPFDAQTVSLAFPGVSLGALPAQSGADAAKLADDDRATIAAAQDGAWRSADSMSYDEVIDPRELRNALLDALDRSRLGRNAPAVGPGPASSPGIHP